MANRIHKIYDGPPDVVYVAMEHNTYCGRIMDNKKIMTSKDKEVTCLNCIANIFKYPELLKKKEEREREAMLMKI
jgi:hypothetical protein